MASLKYYKADLKSKYEKYLKVSLIITLLLVIAAFKFFPKVTVIETNKVNNDGDIIPVEPPVQTKQNIPPDLPKPVVPVVSLSEEVEDLIMDDISIEENENISQPPVITTQRIVEPDSIFVVVEKMPEIIGGMKALQSKLYYPEIVRRANVEGKVIIECVITKEGVVESALVYRSVADVLDEIALNAVKELKFHPGEQRGKPVKVKLMIPIDFRLK